MPYHKIKNTLGRLYTTTRRYCRAYIFGDQFEHEMILWNHANGDQTYRLNYPLTPDSVVFDCGGYKGDWTQLIDDLYGSTIYIFEPVGEFYLHIRDRFINRNNIKIFNYGLHSETASMEIARQENASSMFIDSKLKEHIELMDVVSFVNTHKINKIDLMKINIEGGEFDLLDRIIESGLIHNIQSLQIQFHQFVPGAIQRRKSIRENLAMTHRLTYDYEFVWENWSITD